MPKVAIVTGGASGIGLAVATSLAQSKSEELSVHIIDFNASQGQSIAKGIQASFHQCNTTDYESLSSVFRIVYRQLSRLDFVHANAGVTGPFSFSESCPIINDEPPLAPDMEVLDVNLKAVVTTSWLALHYFRLTRQSLGEEWEGNLIMTASIAGVYTGPATPMYSAAKAGIIGLTRSLAPRAYYEHHVRVNNICPGLVKTGMTAHLGLPAEHMTPIEDVVKAVQMLIDGKAATDVKGTKIEEGKMFGRTVEVSQNVLRSHEMPEYSHPSTGQLLGDIWG